MRKKFLLAVLTAGVLTGSAFGAQAYKNDLRTLFLNNDAVIYEINMRSFNAVDKDGNGIVEVEKGEVRGNFLNAIDRLDELQDYGINAIHLMPINPVGKINAIGTAGSLYAMAEIADIDKNLTDTKSKLTSRQQLKKFIDECHKRNIRVMVDIPACASVDMSKKYPDMFVKDKDGNAIIPVDWTDVRLFKTVEEDGSLNQKLLDEHKEYIDMLIEAGADGIRADVAPIKPQQFWEELISYARSKDPEFMFLAETAEAWAPPKVPSPTANYVKLLEAGFDGYYGNCLNFLNFKSSKDFAFIFKHILKLQKKGIKKSVIGCFDSHDLKSAYITSKDFATAIMYMNATLPLNPYYVDGFQSGDKYDYAYSGKKAPITYTDSDIYHTHKNQIDIFNYSRKPGGDMPEMQKQLKETIALRKSFGDIVTKGSFKMLQTTHKDVYAYQRTLNNDVIITVVNANHSKTRNVSVFPLTKGVATHIEVFADDDMGFKYHNHCKILNELKLTLEPDNAVIIKYSIKDSRKT
ncbi:MAG: hypothetical protein K6C94_10285 [Candidatus Gastranaerophilales bacterium]|nr:hypothetical protein [Candidatus Gastranaerophilales bacterium]